jgi:hypothetical protein
MRKYLTTTVAAAALMAMAMPAAADMEEARQVLDAEIGEQTDVAAQHPDVVAKLKVLADKMAAEIGGKTPTARRPAGEVKGAKTLYPTVDYVPNDVNKADDKKPAAKKGAAKSAASAKPFSLAQAKAGDTAASAAAPQVGQRAFTVAVTVETAQRDAVILAQGGLIGHALYLKGGRVAFAVRHGADEVVEVLSSAEVKGSFTVTASLAADGAMKLVVAGQEAVTGKAKGVLPRQPVEDFCVGHDNGRPVGIVSSRDAMGSELEDFMYTLILKGQAQDVLA